MKKTSITLSLILPYYLFSQTTILDEVNVVESNENSSSKIEIDLEKAQINQKNSLFEMLENESSIDIAGGGSSNAKRVYIRGVESSSLNITLDGATQGKNIFQHRGNELGINPDILKTVNVRTAPDASKSSALGGAVVMTTKDAQDFVKGDKTSGGILKAGYNTNTDSKIGSLTTYGVYNKHFGVLASISGVNSQNYEDGNNQEMLATAYDDRNYLFKVTIDDLNNHDLRLSFNQNSNSGDMQWGRTGSDKGLNVNPALLEEIKSTTTNYTLQHFYKANNLLNLQTDLNFSNILVDRKDANSEYDNDKVGLKVQNHFHIDTKNLQNKISIGFQVEDEETTSNASVTSFAATPSHYAPTSSTNKSLFFQNKTSINNLDIHYGLRFDDYDFQTGLGKASDNTISPNFGLDYKVNDNNLVYANYGEASKMTGTIPFTWMMNIRDNASYSKDLKAEESKRYELGYEFMDESLFTNDDAFIFNANIFKTEIKDLILSKSGITNPTGTKTSLAGEAGYALTDMFNSDETHVSKGFEIKASYYLDNYFATLSYTQLDTNTLIEQIGEPLTIRRVTGFDNKKIVLNTGAEIFEGFNLNYTLTAVKGLDNEQITRGGYTIHDLSSNYKSSSKSPWTLYAAVNNLTNKYYAPHTTLVGSNDDDYRRDMGRDFRFSVKYEF